MRNNRHNRRYHESLERRLLLAAQMIKDINQNGASNPADEPVLYALNSSTALFTYDDGVHGDELWKTDGTPTGTQLVKDIVPGGIGSGIGVIEVGENGVGWFVVHDGTTQSQLWRTDGTTTGTVLVKDFSTGGFGPISQLTASGSVVYFTTTDATNGNELWKSDGTITGTVLVKDINPGPIGSSIVNLSDVGGGNVMFGAVSPTFGREPWVSDGTSGGTHMLADLNAGRGE